jgi:hypothetical protein
MPCLLGYGISTAWERREPLSIICLLKERVGFFFGSYGAQTYPFYGEPNLLNEEVSERIGDPAAWQTQGLLWQPDVMLSPYDTHTADGLVMQPAFSEYRFWQRQTLQGGDSRYTYSLWLWADAVPSATLELVRDADDAVVGRKTVTVHAYPERHHAVGVPEQSGVYRLQVRWDAPTSATNERPVMYAWGAKLEANNQMSGYRAPADQHILRVWSEPLYWWSFIAFWMSAGLLVALRAQMHAGVWASITLVGLIVAESLVVTPEQRFGVVFMTVFWLCPFALLQLWFERYWWRWRAT